MSNLLFLVELTEDENVPPAEEEQPSQVLMRIHCQTDDGERSKEGNAIFNHKQLREACKKEQPELVATLWKKNVNERVLGPRLHATFPGGRVEDVFASSRPLTCQELFHPERAAAIAPLPPRVHAKMHHTGRPDGSGESQLVPPHLDFVASCLRDKCTSPVVFCHNDLQERNILLRVDHETGKDDMLTMIDFEYGNLKFRYWTVAAKNYESKGVANHPRPSEDQHSEREVKRPRIVDEDDDDQGETDSDEQADSDDGADDPGGSPNSGNDRNEPCPHGQHVHILPPADGYTLQVCSTSDCTLDTGINVCLVCRQIHCWDCSLEHFKDSAGDDELHRVYLNLDDRVAVCHECEKEPQGRIVQLHIDAII